MSPPRRPLLRDDPVQPVYLVEVLVQLLVERGIAERDLLAGTGLARRQIENHHSLITLGQTERIFENAWRLADDPGLGVELGCRLRFSHLGTLGAALSAAPTLRKMLDAFVRFHSLLGPAWELAWAESGDVVRIVAKRSIPLGDSARLRTDAWFIAFVRGLVAVSGHAIDAGRIEFDYSAPDRASHRAVCADAASPFDVRFDCAEPAIVCSCRQLDRPLPSGSHAAFGEAVARCEQLLSQRTQFEDLPSMVLRLMRQSAPTPSLAGIAAACGMSERTLERRLSETGVSYRDILEDYRKQRAVALVGDTTVRLDEIAQLLGYSDVSSFGKSFKRWTHESPAAYRAGRAR